MVSKKLNQEAREYLEGLDREVRQIEKQENQDDFSERTVRVCNVYAHENLALAVYHIGNLRLHIMHIHRLLWGLIILGLIALIHWW